MPRDGFISVGNEVSYTTDLDASYSINIKYSPENDSDNRAKSIAGNSLTLLFSPFSIDSDESFIEANIDEFDDSIPSGTRDLLGFYLSKYQQTNSYIVSDANLPEYLDDIEMGSMYYVPNGEQDPNTIRGIALDAPIYAAGFGINSSGEYLNEKKVGPIDLVWNDNIKMWASRQRFPRPGIIIEGTGNPYKAAVLGVAIEEEGEEIYPTGVDIVGEEGLILEEVYHLGEYFESTSENKISIPYGETLSSGDFVTIFYDEKNDIFNCLAEKNKLLIKNIESSDIPAYCVAELYKNTSQNGIKYYEIQNPTSISAKNTIITDNFIIKEGEFAFIKTGYPKICTIEEETELIAGSDLGTSVGSNYLSSGKTGFTYLCQTEDSNLAVVGISSNGGIYPIRYVKAKDAPSDGTINVVFASPDGEEIGDEFSVGVGYV